MAYDVLITNARIVQADGVAQGDIAITARKIVAVGALQGEKAKRVVDAAGLTAIPGLLDTQVHFREPGLEHKEDLESGTRAAIMGGVTGIFEMPNTQPPTTTLEALQDKLKRAKGRTWCDYGFFVGAGADNVGELEKIEMQAGSPGIKVFMGSSTGTLLVDDEGVLRQVLKRGKRPVSVHSEDEARLRQRKEEFKETEHPRDHPIIRDAESCRISTERLIRLSNETGRPVHVLHVSDADELPLLDAAKKAGGKVTSEVTPQHLYFNSDSYEKLGSMLQMNPPIRSKDHQAALWKALENDLFDVFGSDHAPHTIAEKGLPYPKSPSGMPGVQTMLPVLMTFVKQGRLTIEKLVRMACTRPAELFGVTSKGQIAVGYDADIVLIDPDSSFEFTRELVESKAGWSPYEGETLYGKPEYVFLRGHRMVVEGSLFGRPIGEPLRYSWK